MGSCAVCLMACDLCIKYSVSILEWHYIKLLKNSLIHRVIKEYLYRKMIRILYEFALQTPI